MKKRLVLFFKIVVIVFALIGVTSLLMRIVSNNKTEKKDGLVIIGGFCQVAQNIGDLNRDGMIEYLYFCNGKITINTGVSDGGYYDYKLVEDTSSFPDLFSFNSSYTKGYSTTKEVVVFPKNNPQFFAITSEEFTGGSDLKAFGVYRLKSKEIERVFELGFHDLKGRATYPVFSEDKPTFQTVEISLFGGDEKKVTTHYAWNEQKETFERVD
ncbi:MAG: hypothetical protein Q8P80_05660 [Candidatus Levybacteria bacterium]|nr:hypothetical protein [Candidatus Levybacteria bacterium]